MSTDLGRAAEDRAAAELEKQGFKILARNWRSRWCEIDLIVQKAGRTHFVEVKYRSNPSYGEGFDYITADKANRLRRAAAYWAANYAPDVDYQIDIVSVDDRNLEILANAVEG